MGFVAGPVSKVFEATDYQKCSVCVNKNLRNWICLHRPIWQHIIDSLLLNEICNKFCIIACSSLLLFLLL